MSVPLRRASASLRLESGPVEGPAAAPLRIAVLGAGGFIGSHLVPALLARFPKCTVDAVRQFAPAMDKARSKAQRRQICDELLRTIVRDLVPLRPGRQEPRAVKRRPKAYQLLNKPRHKFREVSHRCRYRKAA